VVTSLQIARGIADAVVRAYMRHGRARNAMHDAPTQAVLAWCDHNGTWFTAWPEDE